MVSRGKQGLIVGRFEPAGTVHAPGSKSYMQRALAAALLAAGRSSIRNPSFSSDALAAVGVIKNLGASVSIRDDVVTVDGGFSPKGRVLNCGESGLGIRMFAPIAALHEKSITLMGKGSLLKRPMHIVKEPLEQLGAACILNEGFLPMTVRGPLRAGHITIDGSISSQVITGLLMALPLLRDDTVMDVENAKSINYIDMTIGLLREFGVVITHNGHRRFHISGGQVYHPAEYFVEGDWSGGAFWLVAGCLHGPVTVVGLEAGSLQGDRAALEVIRSVGANIRQDHDRITVERKHLLPFEFDATHCPDLFPPLVVLAAFCNGVSAIQGVSRLYGKESNRAEVMRTEFKKTGLRIDIVNDVMKIYGGEKLHSATMDVHNDHRMAMAASLFPAGGVEQVNINTPSCVDKSYPSFFDDLKKLGGVVYE